MIENKIAKSSLITLDLGDFIIEGERVQLDVSKFLINKLFLKEKDFREKLKNYDWSCYKNKLVAIYCSTDAIVPAWAYMLITLKLQALAKHTSLSNNLEQFESELFDKAISKIDLNQFKDKKVLIKGCNFKYIPFSAYVSISDMLLPVVNSLMYGEACSNVIIYKKKK